MRKETFSLMEQRTVTSECFGKLHRLLKTRVFFIADDICWTRFSPAWVYYLESMIALAWVFCFRVRVLS